MKKASHSLYIILIFAMISCLMTYFGMHYGRLLLMFDWSFHASRVQEIYNNLLQGQLLTFISTKTVQHIGSGTFMFYPTLFLYPWAALRLITNAINAFYIWYGIITFLTFYISYLCMKQISFNKVTAFLFSLVYTGSTYRLGIGQHMIGEFIVTAFLPIAFLGFYEVFWGNKNRWYLLSVGMSLILWTHLLSAFICAEIFCIILFVYIIISPRRKNLIFRIKQLIYSIIVTILLSITFLYEFLYEMGSGRISSTLLQLLNNSAPNLSDIVTLSLSNSDYMNSHSFGLVLIVVAMIGWYFVRKDKFQTSIYIIGIGLLMLSSTVFPWNMFAKTPLVLVQMPHRYLLFSSLFLSVTASYILEHLMSLFRSNHDKILVFGLSISFVILFLGSQTQYYDKINHKDPSIYLQESSSNRPQTLPFCQVDSKNYDYQFDYKETFGESDYLPKAAVEDGNLESLINNIVYVNGNKKRLIPQTAPNTLIDKIEVRGKKNTINLPIVVYRGTNVEVNGKKTPFDISSRGSVLLKNMQKGEYTIKVSYAPNVLFYWMVIINTLSVILLFVIIRRSKQNYHL